MEEAVENDGSDALRRMRKLVEAESQDGVALAENPRDNPICAINIDCEVPCITITWRRYATSAQLRFVHEVLLVFLRQHRVGKILGDDTALPTIHIDDRRWIVDNWLPRAIDAGLKAAANKEPVSHFGKVSVREVQSALSPSLSLRAFADMEKARRWLKSAA